ncbi:MAG TPA: D-alanyl-D-alanine carboxypeptidase/D-alanyl-D-alanine-endopeptidase, partial [Acidobacteriota bacterium]|nr:D-alanyl-D-alanine carboxypeptidase/D-alanyl-D-alanine-endopeptidase [Acidobacteriota bacterium]
LEDPSKGDPLAIFRDWARRLREMGIHQIDGDLIGDARVFGPGRLGTGWAWDDLPLGYAAETAGLQFNENVVLATISPSSQVGSPARLELSPHTAYVDVTTQVVTAAPHIEAHLEVVRQPGSNRFLLRGAIPSGSPPFKRTLAVHDPVKYFLTVFRETLEEQGIRVLGEVAQITDQQPEPELLRRLLFSYESPPLIDLLRIFLKSSQNLYGESIVRVLAPSSQGKSMEAGLEEVFQVLDNLGISRHSYQMVDGSGLSRYNLVTPAVMVQLLYYLYQSRYRDLIMDLLPEAGSDGTLRHRLTASSGPNKVVAKTGTLSNVRALSGYLLRDGGGGYVFSLLINHFLHPTAQPEWFQDRMLEILSRSLVLSHSFPVDRETNGNVVTEP